VIHYVAQAEISESTGMGRVAFHWQHAFESRGHRFMHAQPGLSSRVLHPAVYPAHAFWASRRASPPADVVLAHEPAGAWFALRFSPTIVFSHGIERRGWEIAMRHRRESGERFRLRSRALYPIWRLRQCDFALRHATAVLVINSEDYAYCHSHYGRRPEHMLLFRNGVVQSNLTEDTPPLDRDTVLFIGTWIPRKGIRVLADAALALLEKGSRARWILAGTQVDRDTVLRDWPGALAPRTQVISSFAADEEEALFSRAGVFVLPSFYEGQPLTLLQAMAAGRCCLVSGTCGQKDLVHHGVSGLLHEPGDAATLASQIADCLENGERRRAIGHAARLAVEGRTWQAVSAEVVNFVERVSERHASGFGRNPVEATAMGVTKP
jgi:glycosyltransferase involved in cell wall biosynthesis